jgi:hypothetical protein
METTFYPVAAVLLKQWFTSCFHRYVLQYQYFIDIAHQPTINLHQPSTTSTIPPGQTPMPELTSIDHNAFTALSALFDAFVRPPL